MKTVFKEDKNITEVSVEVKYHSYDNNITNLINYINSYSSSDNFTFKTDDTLHIIKKEEIIYIDIYTNIITLKTIDNEYEFKSRLYKIMEDLNSPTFVQISKSSIINIKYLKRLENSFSGNMCAVLNTGHKLNVSRRYLNALKQALNI